MEHNDQIPGVTFRLVEGNQLPPPPGKGNEKIIAMGAVRLAAEITDLDMWKEVLEKLRCLRIYTAENLAEEMINVAQKKTREVRAQLEEVQAQSGSELETLRQRVSFLTAENAQLRTANQKWAEWAKTQSTE
jgi:hypothetical protein